MVVTDNYDDSISTKRMCDPENDNKLTVRDGYSDGSTKTKPNSQADGSPQIGDSREYIPNRRSKPYSKRSKDYKSLYKRCVGEKIRMEQEFHAKMQNLKKRYTSVSSRLEGNKVEEVSAIQSQHEKEMQSKQALHDKQQLDLEKLKDNQYGNKIKELEKRFGDEKKEIREKFMKQLADVEEVSEKKCKLLNDQIKSLREDDESLNPLTKAVFNCTSMAEIYKIQKLVKNHQLDDVVKNHLPALQNLFLSLSYGVIPICDSQRRAVTDEQRALVEKIQTASNQTVKRLINEKRDQVINLFTIINDSLKLARNAYNRYGSNP